MGAGFQPICEIHKTCLNPLKERIDAIKEETNTHEKVPLGDIFCEICPFLKVHTAYAKKHGEGDALLGSLSTNKKFMKVLQEFPIEAYSGVTGFTSLRIAPIQRVPRYNLLISDLIENTPESFPDKAQLIKAQQMFLRLGEEINQSLHIYQDSVLLQKLDSNLSGNLTDLTISGVHSFYQQHRWSELKRALAHSVCVWCKHLILPGRHYQSCANCDAIVHSRNCIDSVFTTCVRPTLMEQGRFFIRQDTVFYRSDTKVDYKQINLILFNDSLFLYYTKKNNSPVMIAMIRWGSTTTGRATEIVDVGDTVIQIIAPRTFEKHFIQTKDKLEKEKLLSLILSTMENWTKQQELFLKYNYHIRSDSETKIICNDSIDPKVKFIVAGTQEIRSRGDLFNGFIIEVIEPIITTTILKRYEDFISLHTSLKCCFKDKKCFPKLPSNHRLKTTRSKLNYTQSRCRGLEQYLNGLLEYDLSII